MLKVKSHVSIYLRGIRPQVHYATVKSIAGNVITLEDGANTFQVSRMDIVKDISARFWLLN